MQPARQRIGIADRVGLAGEDQEGGLESILGVVQVAKHAPANAQNHRPMAPGQRRESGLLALGAKALQQLSICQLGGVRGAPQLLQMLYDGT